MARAEGLLTVAHAGEEGPAEYIREAIDLLNISRIDHGNHSLDDPGLIRELVERKMPLTLCPLSNLKLRVVSEMKEYPLRTMLDNNMLVTINSDDPAYFGGYVNENFIAVAEALDLSAGDIVLLAKNSFEASFLPRDEKDRFINEIDMGF
jgi:adenine deaminase